MFNKRIVSTEKMFVNNVFFCSLKSRVTFRAVTFRCVVFWYLKGLRHEDFAVLGQFCARIFISPFTQTQNAPVKL